VARTPKGQAKNKANVAFLMGIIESLAERQPPFFNPDAVRSSLGQLQIAWSHVEPELDNIIRAFTSEGGGKLPTLEKKIGGNTYVNKVGASDKAIDQMAATIEGVFDTLKSWRKKALSGGVRVILAGAADFRGTSSGKYRRETDELWIRATTGGRIEKAAPGSYGSLSYVIVHELGHRYEAKNRVSVDFDRPEWWTTSYSRNEGESFAELFALTNFGMVSVGRGKWEESLNDRFEAAVRGKEDEPGAEFQDLLSGFASTRESLRPGDVPGLLSKAQALGKLAPMTDWLREGRLQSGTEIALEAWLEENEAA
jgi:hypothetical protein